MRIKRHRRRFWRVEEADGTLVCVTVFRKGAEEVARRLSGPRETLELAGPMSRTDAEATETRTTRMTTMTRKKGER